MVSIVISEDIVDQLQLLTKQENGTVFSALIGAIDKKNNQVTIISAMHFRTKEITQQIAKETVLKEFQGQLTSLRYLLPFNLRIVGLHFTVEQELSSELLQKVTQDIYEKNDLFCIGYKNKKGKQEYYTLEKGSLKTISIEKQPVEIKKPIAFIHTIETEIPEEKITTTLDMKKAILEGLELLWNKTSLSSQNQRAIKEIIVTKKAIDRIFEVVIPCDEKELASQTKDGHIFLAFDLHSLIYPLDSQMEMPLKSLLPTILQAFRRDLSVKMQRAIFDEKTDRLIPPQKVPLRFFGLELSAYASKDNPSKYELELCDSLIEHAKIMAKLGKDIHSRQLLLGLIDYYKLLSDQEEKIKIITKILLEYKL